VHSLHPRDVSAGQHAAYVDHFVRLSGTEDSVEAAAADALLRHEGDGERARDGLQINIVQQLQEHPGAEFIADGSARKLKHAQMAELAVDGDGTQIVDAGFADFFGGARADIDVHVFDFARVRKSFVGAMQMNGNSGDNAVDPFPGRGADFHGLRGVERVEYGRQAGLREALEAQVSVGSNIADDETGFVDRSNDEAARRAAADGDDHVPEIVDHGMQRRELRANFFREFVFIARNGRRLDKVLQITGEIAGNPARLG
jgi:hypothetical protein